MKTFACLLGGLQPARRAHPSRSCSPSGRSGERTACPAPRVKRQHRPRQRDQRSPPAPAVAAAAGGSAAAAGTARSPAGPAPPASTAACWRRSPPGRLSLRKYSEHQPASPTAAGIASPCSGVSHSISFPLSQQLNPPQVVQHQRLDRSPRSSPARTPRRGACRTPSARCSRPPGCACSTSAAPS